MPGTQRTTPPRLGPAGVTGVYASVPGHRLGMEPIPEHEVSAPIGMPTDPDVERDRLIHDAGATGIDPNDAIELADGMSPGETSADEYRFVDRRIATGYDLDDAEEILMGETPDSDKDPGR
jgi:hypothetical protein